MSIVELRPHLYRLILDRYQVYLWRDDDAVTLIDTGEAGSGPAIADALRQIGLVPTDIDRLVLTHFHDDHAGSAAEVGSWDAVTGPAPPLRVDHEVRDGDLLDFGSARLHHLHSRPHERQYRAVPSRARSPHHRGHRRGIRRRRDPGVFNLNRAEAAASFRRIADLDAEAACFGHGELLIGQASARLQHVASTLGMICDTRGVTVHD